MLTLVIVIVALALLFDFINGMNDAANSIATIVSTRVLTPKQAVAWAAFWNAAAMALVGTAVAKTVSSVVPPAQQDLMIVLGGLCGAIVWAHGCTKFGLPISVSHSLIGGLVGAGYAAQGMGAINFTKLEPTLWFIILAPVIGMTAGAILMTGIYWLFRNATRSGAERFFRAGQLVSSAMFSVGHGSNDAQKIMGIIEEYSNAGLPVNAGAGLIIEVDGYVAGLDSQIEEIADIMKTPIGTVMSRLHHARKNMQKALADYVGADLSVDD